MKIFFLSLLMIAFSFVLKAQELNLVFEKQDVLCYGESTGSATAVVTGGTEPYEYLWSNSEEENVIENLIAGTYSVTVEDAIGTTLTGEVVIEEPEDTISHSFNGNNCTCNGGSDGVIYLGVSGGVSPYDYLWSNDSTTQNLIGISAGTYTVTISDQNDCQYIVSHEVTEPDPFYIETMGNPTICYGQYSEIAIGILYGAVSPYTIVWSNSDNGLTTLVAPLVTTTYFATVIDSRNCESDEIEVTVTVLPEVEIEETSSNVSEICYGDSVLVNLEISGSAGAPYTIEYEEDIFSELPYVLYPEDSDWYFFTVYDSCEFSSVTDSIYISVNPSPEQFSYSQIPSNGILQPGEFGQITLASSETGVVYYITESDQIITQEIEGTGASIDFGDSFTVGSYTIMSRTISSGCETEQGILEFSYQNGISTNSGDKIKIYPNPVKDFILLEGAPQNSHYAIYDIKGDVIEKGIIEDNRIHLNEYTSGAYILVLENKSQEIFRQKFIVE